MPKSRMIYARKLLAQFPDDRQRQIYFSRDYIAPKFFRLSVVDFSLAVVDRNRDTAMRALDDLTEIVPYLHPRMRLLFRLAMPFLRSLFLARILVGAGHLARRVIRDAKAGAVRN
jgi:hypothetical protein